MTANPDRAIRAALIAARPRGYDGGGGVFPLADVSSLGSYGNGIGDVLTTLGLPSTAPGPTPKVQAGAINPDAQGLRSPLVAIPPLATPTGPAPIIPAPPLSGPPSAESPGSGVGLGGADDAPDNGFAPNTDALGQAIGSALGAIGIGTNSAPGGPSQASQNAQAAAEEAGQSGGSGPGASSDGGLGASTGPGSGASSGSGGYGADDGQGSWKRGGYIPIHHTEAVHHALRVIAAHAQRHGVPATLESIHRLIGSPVGRS